MINLQELDMDTLLGQASTIAIKEHLSRHIVSFGFLGKDVTQVQTKIKEVGGSESREEIDYYFIPTQELDKALIVAKAMATLDFMDLPYPLMSERAPATKEKEPKNVVAETKSEVSEEVGPESSEDQGPAEPADKKPRKPRGPNKPKVEKVAYPSEDLLTEEVVAATTNKFVGDLYDTSKQAHKDAFILLLDKEFNGWRNMGKEKSKAMSAALIGQVFLDNKGVVVASFKEQVAAHVKASLE